MIVRLGYWGGSSTETVLTREEEQLAEFDRTQPVRLYRICRRIYADLSGLGDQALAVIELAVQLPKGMQAEDALRLPATH